MTAVGVNSPATEAEVFAAHEGGKLSVGVTTDLNDSRALSIAYTPGVAMVSEAIAKDPALALRYTWAGRLVAVVTDGTAVLGLGDVARPCSATVAPVLAYRSRTRLSLVA
ncbi:hypothetical protein [Actinacidiphila yeochonensis]|uniref:hypothetical protein n=1 Tax=Actinacidiphila yeochonensis TaxID=89050 RepID=UPI00099C72F0